MKSLNELFGPSKCLAALDLFLQNPEEFMNLREVARRLNKNPGSVAQILPVLVDRNYVSLTRIGTKVIAYKLNKDNKIVKHLQQFIQNLEE
jgi:DNA-binding IclR family transcriptional regulator